VPSVKFIHRSYPCENTKNSQHLTLSTMLRSREPLTGVRWCGAAGSSRSPQANHQRHQDIAYASIFYASSPGLPTPRSSALYHRTFPHHSRQISSVRLLKPRHDGDHGKIHECPTARQLRRSRLQPTASFIPGRTCPRRCQV
jgi:hypothetical protein